MLKGLFRLCVVIPFWLLLAFGMALIMEQEIVKLYPFRLFGTESALEVLRDVVDE